MTIDYAKLAALEEAAKAATPGPWFTDDDRRLQGAINATIDGHSRQVAAVDGQAPMFDLRADPQAVANANGRYIAAASPDAMLALVAEIRRLRDSLRDSVVAEAAWKREADTMAKVNEELGDQVDDLAKLIKVTPSAVRAIADDNARLEAENVALRAAADKLTAWAKSCMTDAVGNGERFTLRAWHCIWCGDGGPTTDGDSSDAKEHDRSCTANPLADEVSVLRAEIAGLRLSVDDLRACVISACDAAEEDVAFAEHLTGHRLVRSKRLAELRQLAEAK